MPTPPLPAWMHTSPVRGYRTAHEILKEHGLEESRLFGTESLYGDWSGEVLLLAKDFAASRVIHVRVGRKETRPYRHDRDLRTNVRLRRYADSLRRAEAPHRCGMLYGSALGNLLREDGEMSGNLPSRGAALDYAREVLRFTRDHMPNLRSVVAMGQEAWVATARAWDLRLPWRFARSSAAPIPLDANRVAIVVPHPAARCFETTHATAWARVTTRVVNGVN